MKNYNNRIIPAHIIGVMEIIEGIKNAEITYEQAKERMQEFGKDGLIWFILNPYTKTEINKSIEIK